jgi:hypothetical protein
LVLQQQLRQRGLVVEEWAIAHILAVILDEVEGIKDRGIGGLPMVQLLEPRQAVRSEHHRLAVDREAPGFDPRRQHSQWLTVASSSRWRCGCRAAQSDCPGGRSSASRHA